MADIALDKDGQPITASWLASSLGLDATTGETLTYIPAEESTVRGPHSATVRLDLSGCRDAPRSVFLKRVVPADLSQRSPDKWLRDAASYRSEINFSRLWVPLLAEKGVRLPAIHATVAEGVAGLSVLLKEGDGAAPADERILATVSACKFLILSEDLQNSYGQKMLLDR
ncbi:hypothetical protein T484DRAFT_3504587 [Baffinella frigidus]|nr:hypothetical protein T484DRAFT_3504587 [Cryptophyta sp. CCMP2293]